MTMDLATIVGRIESWEGEIEEIEGLDIPGADEADTREKVVAAQQALEELRYHLEFFASDESADEDDLATEMPFHLGDDALPEEPPF